jgi:hypothetical protein
MRFLNFLVPLLLISCGGAEVKRDLEDQGYQTSGIEQYFLPELPLWSNFSVTGMCFKSSSFTYFDFKKLKDSYQLQYDEMLELQGQYNARVENYYRSTATKFLKPVEQASFFSNTLEQIRGGVRSFKIPRVDAVDVIWLDSFVTDKKVTEIIKMFQSGKFDERLPILFSTCFSRGALAQWITENNLEDAGFYSLGAEWLTPFNDEANRIPALQINLTRLLPPGTKINIITSGSHSTLSEIVKAP